MTTTFQTTWMGYSTYPVSMTTTFLTNWMGYTPCKYDDIPDHFFTPRKYDNAIPDYVVGLHTLVTWLGFVGTQPINIQTWGRLMWFGDVKVQAKPFFIQVDIVNISIIQLIQIFRWLQSRQRPANLQDVPPCDQVIFITWRRAQQITLNSAKHFQFFKACARRDDNFAHVLGLNKMFHLKCID